MGRDSAPGTGNGDWLYAGAAATVTRLLDFYAEREKIGAAGVPLHDPCTIGYLIDPTLFRGERIHVASPGARRVILPISPCSPSRKP